MIDESKIEYLLNGEKAEADILNRPIKQLTSAVNTAFSEVSADNSNTFDEISDEFDATRQVIEERFNEVFEVTRDGNGFTREKDAKLIFNSAAGTVSIAPGEGKSTWFYYHKGRKIESSDTITYTLSELEKVNGGFYLSFNKEGNLVNTGPRPDFFDTTLCFYVHYAHGEFIIEGDERHAADRDTAWHHSHHREDGMVVYTLGTVGWVADDATKVGIELTTTLVADEDLQHLIKHSDTGEEPFSQILEGSQDTVRIPTLYYDGSIRYLADKKLPWVSAPLKYNDGAVIKDVPNGKFVNYFLAATHCQKYPIKLIMGRKIFDTDDETVDETLESYGLNFPEMAMLYRIAIQRDNSASTVGKCKLKSVQQAASKITFESAAGSAGSGLSNHAQLLGRTEDNAHPISAITGLSSALDAKVDKSTKVIAGRGLSGGGDLSTDKTLTVKYGTAAGTAAQGNDARLSNSREWTASTITQLEAETGTATTRRAFTSQRVRQSTVAWWNSASGAFGKDIITSATADNARTKLGLGNTATRNIGTTAGTVAAGDDARFTSGSKTAEWAQVSGKPATATRWPSAAEVTGLGNSATRNVGTASGTVAAGNDSRLTNQREWTGATISQAEAEAGTATTRRAFTSQRVRQSSVAYWNSITGIFGRDLVTSSTNAVARSKLGLSDASTTTVATIRAGTTWANVQGKPSTYTPSTHTHPHTQVTGLGNAATRNVGTASGNVVLVDQRNNSVPSINTLDAVGSSINAWNRPGNYITRLDANNNTMAFSVGSATNERTASIQVGHGSLDYAVNLGVLQLNPLGGDVRINKNIAYHSGNMPATATRWPTFAEVTSKPAQATRWPTWAEVTSKPATYAPSSHTHPHTQVTGLGTAATKNVGTGGGNVMEVGAFGLGASHYHDGDTLLGGGNRIVNRSTSDGGLPNVGGYSDRSSVIAMNTNGHRSWIQVTDQGLYFAWGYNLTSLPQFQKAATINSHATFASVVASGNITAYSDERLKENIEVIPSALDKVKTLGGYTFDRKDAETLKQTGVIAQEVQKVLPEAVIEGEDGYLSVAYGNMVGLLIEAIKEQSKEMDILKEEINKLKERL